MLKVLVYVLPCVGNVGNAAVQVTVLPARITLGVQVPVTDIPFIFAPNELMLTTPGWVSVNTTLRLEPVIVFVYAASTQLKPPYDVH